MLKRSLKNVVAGILIAGMFLIMSGCAKIRFTTGLTRNQFARIDGQEVSMDTARLLLSEYKLSYELLFDEQVWQKDMNGITTEDYIKNTVRDTIESIVLAKNMAKELNITITEDENEQIKAAASEYMEGLDENTAQNIDVSVVEEFYESLLLAEKGFYAVTDSVDTKVSTDEARLIYVQYMFFGTMTYDENHKAVSVSDGIKLQKKELADSVLKQLKEGGDFLTLAKEYSDDVQNTLELGQGDYIEEFVDVSFDLESGEISDVVETEYGYYIIKCINYNVESDYEKQCEKVVLARRRDIYTERYLDYANGKTTEYNDYFWEKTDIEDINRGSGELFEIYKKYFY